MESPTTYPGSGARGLPARTSLTWPWNTVIVKSIPTQLIVNPDAALRCSARFARHAEKAVNTSRVASLAVQFAIPNPCVHIDMGVAAEFLP